MSLEREPAYSENMPSSLDCIVFVTPALTEIRHAVTRDSNFQRKQKTPHEKNSA